MKDNPRIYIGTLYSGENEYDEMLKSLKNQNHTNWTHEVFKNLPNKEAHDKLYSRIMELKNEYDLFIKLDADMVFDTNEALDIIINYFKNSSKLDHLILRIKDWFTDKNIIGLHTFTNNARWKKSNEMVFVDPNPIVPGLFKIETPKVNIINHSPNPSDFQAFHFGIHRSIKAIQKNKLFNFNWTFAKGQRNTIKHVYSTYQKTNDKRLLLAIAGAKHLYEGKFEDSQYNYKNKDLKKFFDDNKKNILTKENELIEFMEKDFDKLFLKKTLLKFIISVPKNVPRILKNRIYSLFKKD